MTDHEHATVFEFSKITESLFLGTNLCCQSHFSEQLLSLGITVDISLEEEHIDAPFGVESYLWLPVEDHAPPTDDQLQSGIAFMTSALSLGKKLYIHCKNGHGRGPTLVAAYLISTGKTADDAIALLLEKRPAVHLEVNQVASLNRLMMKFDAHQKAN